MTSLFTQWIVQRVNHLKKTKIHEDKNNKKDVSVTRSNDAMRE